MRPTESRIPAGFVLADLGQSAATPDNRAALVSYNPSPVAAGRIQAYVVFVLDNGLAGQVDHYDWAIQNDAANSASTTSAGYLELTPQAVGSLTIKVTLKEAGDQDLATLTLDQVVVPLNPELEALYTQTGQSVPLAGQPETSREIVNDLRANMDDLAPRDADPSSSLNRLLFSISYAEALEQPAERRNPSLEVVATGFEKGDPAVFVEEGRNGLGVCRIRPHVLAMFLPQTPGGNDWYLAPRELPADESDRLALERQLAEELKALAPEKQVDLYNLLRFPRSNFRMALQLLDGLRAQYFAPDTSEAIVNEKDKALSLLDQFKHGPHVIA